MSTDIKCSALKCIDNENGKCILKNIYIYLENNIAICTELDLSYDEINTGAKNGLRQA